MRFFPPCSFNPGNVEVYYGDKFPTWKGNLRVILDDKGKLARQTKIMTGLGHRVRDVRVGPDGYVYVLTDVAAPNGAMLRLEPGK